MVRVWTAEQKAAIGARQGNFLVTAGAGSGKTAVLTERVRELVDSGSAALSEILVLTFTDKAAREMKGRIRDAFLAEGKAALADEAENADIATFDSFAYGLVKRHHEALGLPADVAICDEAFLEAERRKILADILNAHYEARDPSFLSFVRHYALKDDEAISSLVLRLADEADLSADKKSFFADCREGFFSSERFAAAAEEYRDAVIRDLTDLRQASAYFESAEEGAGWDAFLAGLASAPSYEKLHEALREAKMPRAPRRANQEEGRSKLDKALAEGLRKKVAAIQKSFLWLGTLEEQRGRQLATKPFAAIFVSLTEELDGAFAAFKKEKAAYSFADIASFARELATLPSVGEELRSQYRYVMVDEYQDTSDLQERFLQSLSEGNLFAVGDVKQSIYRFRNANPKLFLERSSAYKNGAGGELLTLRSNFRSRPEPIADLNQLFASVMSERLGEVAYDESQALVCGNKAPIASSSPLYQTEVISYRKPANKKAAECEARLIATDILAKMQAGFLVGGPQNPHPAGWGDFAILIARKRDFPIYERVFGAAKMPLALTEEKDLASEDVAMAFLSLLRLIAAPAEDDAAIRHAYASLKRSYAYAESDKALFAELKDGSYLNDPLFRYAREGREAFLQGGSREAVERLLHEIPFIARLPVLGEVKGNYEKLLSFEEAAGTADRLGLSFAEYVSHFADLRDYGVPMASPAGPSGADAVKLMTIHAAKGLEFPIVYIPDLFAKPNLTDLSGGFIFSRDYGLILPTTLSDEDPYLFLHRLAKEKELKAELSERMRLFYVALTRAKDKIALIQKEDPGVSYARLGEGTLLRLASKRDEEGKNQIQASIKTPMSFADFLALSGLHFPTRHLEAADPVPFGGKEAAEHPIPAPSFFSVSVVAEEKKTTRASEASFRRLDEGALAYGIRLHRLMEVADLRAKDVSFIADPRERALIARILALPLFADLKDAEIFREYAFCDEESGLHGSIDLLLAYPDREVIVDYKTKDLAEEAYPRQLAAYRRYVEKVFGKKARTFLLSLVEGTLKEIE